MKRLMLIVSLVSTLFAMPANADSFWMVMSEALAQDGQSALAPNASFYVQADKVMGSTGVFGFAQQSHGWGQMYGGPIHPVTKVWSIGAGLGFEQNGLETWSPRLGLLTSVIGHPKYFLLGFYEFGQDDWYRVIGRYKFPGNVVQFGPMVERHLGVGVQLAATSERSWLPSEVSVAYLGGPNGDQNNVIVAVSKLFP